MDYLKFIDRKLKYRAHRVKVFEDTLEKPTGEKVYYDFVENRNGSGVLLVDNEGKLLFVKQYRNSINDIDIEIPAGCAEVQDFENNEKSVYKRDDFESVDNPFYKCAIRESEEETGYIPQKLKFVNYIIAAAGLFSERTAIYIGTDLKQGEMHRDLDEYIDVVRLTPEDAMRYINDGIICDSKTIIAILYYLTNEKKFNKHYVKTVTEFFKKN